MGRSSSAESSTAADDALLSAGGILSSPGGVAHQHHLSHNFPLYPADSPGGHTTSSSYSYLYSSNASIPGLLPASSGSTGGSSSRGAGSSSWYNQPSSHHHKQHVLQSAPGRFGGAPARGDLPQETAMSSLARALANSAATTAKDRSPAPPPGFFAPPLVLVDEEGTEGADPFDDHLDDDDDDALAADFSTTSLDPSFLREIGSPSSATAPLPPSLQRQTSRGSASGGGATSRALAPALASVASSSNRRQRGRRSGSKGKPSLQQPQPPQSQLHNYQLAPPQQQQHSRHALKPHNAANPRNPRSSSLASASSLASSLSSSSYTRSMGNNHHRGSGSGSLRLSDASAASTAAAAAAEVLNAGGGGGGTSGLPSSEAIRQLLLKPSSNATGVAASPASTLPALPPSSGGLSALPTYLDLEPPGPAAHSSSAAASTNTPKTQTYDAFPILPQALPDDFSLGLEDPSLDDFLLDDDDEDDFEGDSLAAGSTGSSGHGSNPYGEGSSPSSPLSPRAKKREWLLRMNRKLEQVPVGELDASWPLTAIMNAWAKTKSAQGASMVELWLTRIQKEYECGNVGVGPTAKMYTMAGTKAAAHPSNKSLYRASDSLTHSRNCFVCS